jgi:hypothetical protein
MTMHGPLNVKFVYVLYSVLLYTLLCCVFIRVKLAFVRSTKSTLILHNEHYNPVQNILHMYNFFERRLFTTTAV